MTRRAAGDSGVQSAHGDADSVLRNGDNLEVASAVKAAPPKELAVPRQEQETGNEMKKHRIGVACASSSRVVQFR
ncbi:hypothetical protein MRX96_009774 [Rhipicephalus microplus]